MTLHLMPASTNHPTCTTDPSRREGVRTMFKLHRNRERTRAREELSATDRAVLVEVVRQRREEQELERADLQARTTARHVR